MSIKLQLPKLTDLKPRITVVGVGGAGGNAINNMISSGLTGVDFIVANTDAQALAASSAERRIQLGINLTEGLGAGSKPEIGMAAAEEALDEIRTQIAGSHMVFIAAGMGGGTGTGAAAVIARIARELDVLAVGIVTKPFQFEGSRRMRAAESGIAELKKYVDTLIVIPNQNLFRVASERTTFAEAFLLADQVLYAGIACIVDLIVRDGLINLDFADVRTVMKGMGSAMMGTGEAEGDRRAVRAAEDAIANPLLDNVTLEGAKAVLLSIIGGEDMTLYEVDEAASRVRQEVDAEANIIVGATFDARMGDRVRVAIVASGMREEPMPASVMPNAPPVPRVGPPPLPPSPDRGPDAPMRGGRFGEPLHPSMPPPQGRPGRYEAGPHDPQVDHQPYGYQSSPPEDHPRGGRRIPHVIDFPNVGQREYHAKMAQYSAAQSNAQHGAGERESRARSWAGGLLRRLVGGESNRSDAQRRKNSGDNSEVSRERNDSDGPAQRDLPKFFSRYRA